MIHGTNHYLQWEIARESKKYQTTYFCPELNEDIDVEIKFGPVSFNNPERGWILMSSLSMNAK